MNKLAQARLGRFPFVRALPFEINLDFSFCYCLYDDVNSENAHDACCQEKENKILFIFKCSLRYILNKEI